LKGCTFSFLLSGGITYRKAFAMVERVFPGHLSTEAIKTVNLPSLAAPTHPAFFLKKEKLKSRRSPVVT